MGDPFVGVVHPCKIYNILRLGIPFLYIGPPESHVTDLVADGSVNVWAMMASHGDVDAVVSHIRKAAARGAQRYDAEAHVSENFSQNRLLKQLATLIEDTGAGKMAESVKAERSVYAGR